MTEFAKYDHATIANLAKWNKNSDYSYFFARQ